MNTFTVGTDIRLLAPRFGGRNLNKAIPAGATATIIGFDDKERVFLSFHDPLYESWQDPKSAWFLSSSDVEIYLDPIDVLIEAVDAT